MGAHLGGGAANVESRTRKMHIRYNESVREHAIYGLVI